MYFLTHRLGVYYEFSRVSRYVALLDCSAEKKSVLPEEMEIIRRMYVNPAWQEPQSLRAEKNKLADEWKKRDEEQKRICHTLEQVGKWKRKKWYPEPLKPSVLLDSLSEPITEDTQMDTDSDSSESSYTFYSSSALSEMDFSKDDEEEPTTSYQLTKGDKDSSNELESEDQ